MKNIFKSVFVPNREETNLTSIPILVAIVIAYLATMLMQYSYQFKFEAGIGFTITLFINVFIYLYMDKLFKNRYWLYFCVQGIFLFDYAVIMKKGYEPIFFALTPILIFQSMTVFHKTIEVILTSVYFYAIFCGTIIAYDGVHELFKDVPILVLMTMAVRSYSLIFLNQVKSRIQTQKILQELEMAYEKVEELTLVNERQRVARDLHDILSQGLAGIIMQLEAASANLDNNNTKRAGEILNRSMEHARNTLGDARLVIDNLRLQVEQEKNLAEALENEIVSFRAVSGVVIKTQIRIQSKVSTKLYKHVQYIVREALSNITKHAEAGNVIVEVLEEEDHLNIHVWDDGKGFDVKLLDQMFGHYGILGMKERVKAIDGKIKVKSKIGNGTDIKILIPVGKGIHDGSKQEENFGS